jgi:endonuclease/exonuclease/phosphatase family metal-dependent hydrolase
MATLRVASYNVRGLKDDRAALGEVIRELAPDVLFVQEAPRRFRWRQGCAELARRGGMFYASGGLPGLGNLILVSLRVRVHEAWGLRFPLTPGRHMRGAALARCSLGRGRFLAVGTHLSTDDAERPAQAALLAAMLRDLESGVDRADRGGVWGADGGGGAGGSGRVDRGRAGELGGSGGAVAVLFGGDLNETDAGAAWRTLAAGRTDIGRADPAFTFSVASPRRRIDALFVPSGMPVAGYRVVDTPAVRRASDHFPICAEVTFL